MPFCTVFAKCVHPAFKVLFVIMSGEAVNGNMDVKLWK